DGSVILLHQPHQYIRLHKGPFYLPRSNGSNICSIVIAFPRGRSDVPAGLQDRRADRNSVPRGLLDPWDRYPPPDQRRSPARSFPSLPNRTHATNAHGASGTVPRSDPHMARRIPPNKGTKGKACFPAIRSAAISAHGNA